MKSVNISRSIFYIGVDVLKILLFTVAVALLAKFLAVNYLDIPLKHEATYIFGFILSFILVIYDFISLMIKRLANKLYQFDEQKKAISILENYGMKVGLLLTDLPKDQNNNEIPDCINAYITLSDHDMPFVFINSQNEVSGRVFLLGAHGRLDHNKYRLLVARDTPNTNFTSSIK